MHVVKALSVYFQQSLCTWQILQQLHFNASSLNVTHTAMHTHTECYSITMTVNVSKNLLSGSLASLYICVPLTVRIIEMLKLKHTV